MTSGRCSRKHWMASRPVERLGDDLHVALAVDHGRDPFPQQRMIVDAEDPDLAGTVMGDSPFSSATRRRRSRLPPRVRHGASRTMPLERDGTWHPQLDFGAGVGRLRIFSVAPIRSARSRMPVMPQCPSLPATHDLRIDAPAVVAHQNAQLLGAYSSSSSTCCRARMPEGVDQPLPADPIDLVADHRLELRGRPSTMTRIRRRCPIAELLLDTGRTPAPDRAARLPTSAGRGPRCGPRRSPVPSGRGRGRARPCAGESSGSRSTATCSCIDALTKPCSSVSCSSCAMRVRSARRSSNRTLRLPRHLPDAQAVRPTRRAPMHDHGRSWNHAVCHTSGWISKRQRRLGAVPETVAVGRDHAKAIGPGRQIGIDGLALGDGLAPVAIEAVEAVAEPHALGHRQAQAGVAERDPAAAGRTGESDRA